ncbi:beta strand repeat-containing protein [Luteolibacter soli]|uniref:Autotransporter-associated beta strand repeat-containing protein n=1 Tax=Luteolibacter soli TaxID=3135280 RepID=A0ABU9AU50_9BACT
MKPTSSRLGAYVARTTVATLLATACQTAYAAFIDKADNADNLNLTSSWNGGVVPGSNDLASWFNLTGANTVSLGADLSLKGIAISSTGGAVTLNGANTLTIGSSGLDLSSSTQNLTINANVATGAGSQPWSVISGQTLSLQTGTFTRAAAAGVVIDKTLGAGTITASNISNTNGIVGPWMSVRNTGAAANASSAGYTYAANGAALDAYLGATASANYGYATSTTANYDVNFTGNQTFGSSRDANTVRHIGGAATLISNSAQTWGFNGLMNAGTGLLTLGDTGNQVLNIKAGVGTGTELVLHAASGNISILDPIINNGANASSVTVNGPGTVTLNVANTYTGGTTINSGTVATTQNLGAASSNAVLNSGAILSITGAPTNSNVLTGGGTINSTGATISGNWSNFAGSYTHNNTLASTSYNAANATSKFAAYNIASTQGGAQGMIAGFNTGSASGTYTLELGSLTGVAGSLFRGGNTAQGIATLRIGNLNTSTTFAGTFNDGTNTKIAIDKVGSGTLTLSGSSGNTAGVSVSSGTLLLTGGFTAAGNAMSVANGATLAGTGSVAGTATIASGGIMENGNGGSAALTFGGLTFGGAATVNAHYSGTGPALAVTGALATTPANGQVTLNVASAVPLANGTHNIISYGSFGGAATNFSAHVTSGLNTRQSALLVLSGNNVALQVAGDSPKWTGARNDGLWTTTTQASPKNWKLITGGTATDFISGDNVLFDDTATGTTALNLDGGITAGVVEFNNSTKAYSISSTTFGGLIDGALIKNGTGSLTINTTNSYSGGTTFNGGTLNLNSDSALGSGLFTIGAGSAKVLNNGSGADVFFNTNPTQQWADDFTFTGSNSLDVGSGAVTISGAGTDRTVTVSSGSLTVGEVKAAAHGLIKQGTGTLVLSSDGAGAAASTLAGTLNIAAGTIQINRATGNSGDLTATGLTGTGTITNGAAIERWFLLNTTGTSTFTGTLANGGTGGLGFNKQGAGSVTLSGNLSYTGQTTVEGGTLTIPVANTGAGSNAQVTSGTLVMGHPSAFGTAGTIRLAGNNVSTFDMATDGGDNAYGIVWGTGTIATIVSDRATAGAGINHTLSTLGAAGVGGGTITITSGVNVTSGAGRITFTNLGLSAGTVQTTALNPTSANVTVGPVSKVANTGLSQTLELGGTTLENEVSGVISNGDGAAIISVIKSNSSTWTISNTNTYTGTTTVGTANGAGILRATATNALGTGTMIFDGSGGTPGPTSRLELSNNITLPNNITLSQRNNTSAAILNVSGNNTLTGAIDLNAGGNAGNIASDGGLLSLSGNISTTTAVARNLHLGGAGNGQASGVISNGATATGVVSVTKEGAGSWTLSGANTYTGATVVSAGTLNVSQAVLADAATVNVASAGVLNLTHALTDTVDRFYIDGVEQASGTWGSLASTATHKTARITGTGMLLATNGVAAGGYSTWATTLGLTAGVNDGAAQNPDNDGFENGTEYILGGHPLNGSNNPKIYALVADSDDVGTDKELIMTIAVPQGTPAFPAGSPTSSVTFEGFGITVKGSTSLATFPVTVNPVAPVTTGLPAAPTQGGITYEYRSFSLGGSNGATGRGFLQVTVTNP